MEIVEVTLFSEQERHTTRVFTQKLKQMNILVAKDSAVAKKGEWIIMIQQHHDFAEFHFLKQKKSQGKSGDD